MLLFIGTTAEAGAANGIAVRLTPDTALYAVSYSLTTENDPLLVPALAKRSTTTEIDSVTTNYSFSTSLEGIETAGTATGLVLSSAALRDNQYYVPQHTTEHFTLFVVLTLDPDDTRAKYGMQMTNLPFTILKDQKEQKLNTTALRKFKTKEIGLGV